MDRRTSQKKIRGQKIVVFDFPGHPFQYDLSRKLSEIENYRVYHIYNPKQLGPKSSFQNSESLKVITVPKYFSKNHFVRLKDEFIYGFLIFINIYKINPDVIISSNMPLIPQSFFLLYSKMFGKQFIFWLQDIISIAAEKILKKQKNILSSIVGRFFNFLEFFLLRNSDHIITISKDFDHILINSGIIKENITCIPNWAPINDIPVLPKKNSFSVKHNLDNSFNILYSGTMGFKHNPDVLYDLGVFLDKFKIDAKVVVVTEGDAVEYLKNKVKNSNLDNFKFLPFQDFDIFPEVLATADISLVMLEEEAGEFCVPSKLLSILCSKRIPLLFLSEKNLASRIVLENECGFHVNNQDDLNKAIQSVYNNIEQYDFMRENTLKYAKNYFNIDKITDQFLTIIKN
jgi:colanic acid biosynthesis glycosyl transferase WcaI